MCESAGFMENVSLHLRLQRCWVPSRKPANCLWQKVKYWTVFFHYFFVGVRGLIYIDRLSVSSLGIMAAVFAAETLSRKSGSGSFVETILVQ